MPGRLFLETPISDVASAMTELGNEFSEAEKVDGLYQELAPILKKRRESGD